MITILSNPTYDAVFKFLMEDQEVAKHVLSAFLKQKVVKVQMTNTENTVPIHQLKVKLYRLDFSAYVVNEDGTEQQVLIEMQKTGNNSDILRFRQYLGGQYFKGNNMSSLNSSDFSYGPPIISIYILGHCLKKARKPVIYVNRTYFDYNNNIIEQRDPFIESLTHDSIIVQVPLLQESTSDPLSRLLRFFNQKYCNKTDEFKRLRVNIDKFDLESDKASAAIFRRLLLANASEKVQQEMLIEAQVVASFEQQATLLMEREDEIQQKNETIAQKDETIAQKEETIAQKNQSILSAIQKLKEMGMNTSQITEILSLSETDIA